MLDLDAPSERAQSQPTLRLDLGLQTPSFFHFEKQLIQFSIFIVEPTHFLASWDLQLPPPSSAAFFL